MYEAPTREELRALLKAWGLTAEKTAELTYTADPRTVRRWTQVGGYSISKGKFALLVNHVKGITLNPDRWREQLADDLKGDS